MKRIIRRPLITEKSLALAAKGWYTFVVDLKANRAQIALAVHEFYKVDAKQVRTISMPGKARRVGRKMTQTKKSDWKKALVHLGKGQTISAFEVTNEAPKSV